MSLSTCEHCGGHIPLGPDASNRCESCGLGVFDAHTDPFPAGHLGDYLLQLRAERDRYRKALEEVIANETAYNNYRSLALQEEMKHKTVMERVQTLWNVLRGKS